MLGIDLCQELKGGYNLVGIDLCRHIRSKVTKYFKCDITDKKRLNSVICAERADIVVHLAAWTNVDGCELEPSKAYDINCEGTRNIALACKSSGAVLVFVSTDFVFDGKKRTLYRETDKPNPLSVYGDSKFKGEEAVKSVLDKYFIIRTSWLYGRYGKNFVDTIAAKGASEVSLRVVSDQVGSPTYSKHLVKAIHTLLDKVTKHGFDGYGIYQVSNTGKVSWFKYAKEILRLTGSRAKVIPITSRELDRPAKRPSMSAMDNTKFIKLTGYRMPCWQAALKEYLSK